MKPAARGKFMGGKGGGGSRPQSRQVTVSKALSFLLRHGAEDEGVDIDEGGWVNVADVLHWRRLASLNVTFEELSQIVNNNDKQRFSLEPLPPASLATSTSPRSTTDPSQYRIRASQGHSVTGIANSNIHERLDPSSPDCPTLVVHGTYPKSWEEIKKFGGLKPMKRTHIHFATDLPEKMPPLDNKPQNRSKPKKDDQDDGVISGMRKDASIVVWVDVKRSVREGGVEWWRSRNGVILTDGVEKIIGHGEEARKEKVLELQWVSWVEARRPEGGGEVLWGKRDEGWEEELRRGKDAVEQGLGTLNVEDRPAAEKLEERKGNETDRDGARDGGDKGPVKDDWDD